LLSAVDCSKNSELAYFLDKQCESLTGLKITTASTDALTAISKCRNLKNLHLYSANEADEHIFSLDGLEYISNLKCFHLDGQVYWLGHRKDIIQCFTELELELEPEWEMNDIDDEGLVKDVKDVINDILLAQKPKLAQKCKTRQKQNIEYYIQLNYLELFKMEGITKTDLNEISDQLTQEGIVEYIICQDQYWPRHRVTCRYMIDMEQVETCLLWKMLTPYTCSSL
jgi:hypothetical protein